MSTESNQEVVHEGWLTKSPPSKRIWRARWRRRWFALRQSGELPGQYFLEYYTDRNCRKLKGTIDLDQCEQVDAGLRYEQRKMKYQFMFDIKTPSRTYYLAAETEQDMNSWVEYICQVCSLKVYTNEYLEQFPEITPSSTIVEQPPDVEATEITEESDSSYLAFTGPYIPISQCITGKPLPITDQHSAQTLPRCYNNNNNVQSISIVESESYGTVAPLTPVKKMIRKNSHTGSYNASIDSRFYDSPRKHALDTLTRSPETYTNVNLPSGSSPTLQSPTTDSESVFTDEEWSHSLQQMQLMRTSRQSDSSIEPDPSVLTATQKFTKLTQQNSRNETAPPRPPKPLHLTADGPSHNYLNLESSKPTIAERRAIKRESQEKRNSDAVKISNESNAVADDMYDFPRTHHTSSDAKECLPKHCYNNAAPVVVNSGSNAEGHVFRYDISPSAATEFSHSSVPQVFQYDFHNNEEATDEPASPCSQSSCSTTAMYSNVPSPLLPPNQNAVTPPAVNRGLKPGRGLSSDSVSLHSLNEMAPTVNRKLKPVLKNTSSTFECNSQDNGEYGNIRKPDLISAKTRNSFNELSECHSLSQYNSLDSPTNLDILQYLDLDLDVGTTGMSTANISGSNLNNSLQASAKPDSRVTVYKTVDFVRTEAFNRTKKSLEAERNKFPNDSA